MTQSTKAIAFSLSGLLILLASGIFTMLPSGLNVHSGEIFIYLFLLLIGLLIAPFYLFFKSVRIAKSFENEHVQSSTQKLAILLTVILGFGIGIVILGIIWITAFPK